MARQGKREVRYDVRSIEHALYNIGGIGQWAENCFSFRITSVLPVFIRVNFFPAAALCYGSLILRAPCSGIRARNKLPVLGMIDTAAVVTLHRSWFRSDRFQCRLLPRNINRFLIGRCLYGWSLQGTPLNRIVASGSAYESGFIYFIVGHALVIANQKQFAGQIFGFTRYSCCWRPVLELFRGDEARGYIIDGWLPLAKFIFLYCFCHFGCVLFPIERKSQIRVMKIVKRIIVATLLVLALPLAYFYFGNYSEGVRSGVVVKVSKKASCSKHTRDNSIYSHSELAKSMNMVAETFDFSVPTHSWCY